MTRPSDPLAVVVLSLERWDDVWRRNQYLIDGLLREFPGLEVLFVEPPADPVHALTQRRLPRTGAGLAVVDGYQGRLRTLEPTKWLPRRLGDLADRLLRRGLLRAVKRRGWNEPVLWVNDPGWWEMVRSTGWPALYDITDDWVEASRGEREHERMARADHELLASCAEVVVCSTTLESTKGRIRPVTLIRNAVDVERYRRRLPRPSDLPEGPVALYAGTLHEDRLDIDLVRQTALRLAEVGARLALLGPDALTPAHSEALRATPAVDMLGARHRDAVPAYLQHADALIVPHLIDDFTESLDPIKLYEYLAVGRPIVSTAVAGFRDIAGQQSVFVRERALFADTVAAVVSDATPTIVHEGVPDWSERASAMADVVARVHEQRGRR